MSEIAKKGKFKVSWLPGEYEGYALTGPADTFNGNKIPYFSLEEMWRIVSAIYDTAKPDILLTEDGEMVLHPLGGQAWEWEKIEVPKVGTKQSQKKE